jgi:hypothetical protein
MGLIMVKGATRRIVEIKETGSQYFERAIFFVNMENHHHTSENTLSQEARKIIDHVSNDKRAVSFSKAPGKKDVVMLVTELIGSAAFGAFITLLFTEII